MMDASKLIEILKGTIDPNQREAAEKQLDQVGIDEVIGGKRDIAKLPVCVYFTTCAALLR